MSKKRKLFNIGLVVLLSAIFIILAKFSYSESYTKLIDSCKELWVAIKFYFFEMFGVEHNIKPITVKMQENRMVLSNVVENIDIPNNTNNMQNIGVNLLRKVGVFAKIVVMVLPCIVLIFYLIKKAYRSNNTKHNVDTIPLKIYKGIAKLTYYPLKRSVLSFVLFIKEHKFIWAIWVLIWMLNLNIFSILIKLLSYYFYFAVKYDFKILYVQLRSLVPDLIELFFRLPFWCSGFIVWSLFNKFRKNVALRRLNMYEARNCGFINELPIVSITCGSMGKRKTTMITDMALSQEVMFRQKALSILQNNDMKFPFFAWISFENDITKCMEFGVIYNLASIKEWIKKKRLRYEKHGNSKLQLYGYDSKRYGIVYDDGLRVSNIFEVLETYALAYFIYVIQSSLIVSNYSIRQDSMLFSEGNFPMWGNNFFPENYSKNNRYSHILDFDILRLGRKVIENNPKAGSFEFGVVVISEIGKERGNSLELKEVKKGNIETNQKNDLFNSWLKMCRHSATVDNVPFIKVFTDEQRPESWGADARDLCDIVHIISTGEQKLALPFYALENRLSKWMFSKFMNMYYDFRYRRGDNTLLIHILKGLTTIVYRRNIRNYNRFGYSILQVEKERGTMGNERQKRKYYIMNKKIYSDRFSTDCFSDYFNDLAKNSKLGLMDYIEYANKKATVSELKKQNSYFINSLYKDTDANNED